MQLHYQLVNVGEFQFGACPFDKRKPDKLVIYVRMEVKDIHLDCTVRTVVNSRADTDVQHSHIGLSVECDPYGINSVCGSQFIRIVYT